MTFLPRGETLFENSISVTYTAPNLSVKFQRAFALPRPTGNTLFRRKLIAIEILLRLLLSSIYELTYVRSSFFLLSFNSCWSNKLRVNNFLYDWLFLHERAGLSIILASVYGIVPEPFFKLRFVGRYTVSFKTFFYIFFTFNTDSQRKHLRAYYASLFWNKRW